FQGEKHWYFLGLRRAGDGHELFLEKRDGQAVSTVASTAITVEGVVALRIAGDEGRYDFGFDPDGNGWQWLKRDDDATILSTHVAGGFVGAMLGPYARDERQP